jgi:hypothetical protein
MTQNHQFPHREGSSSKASTIRVAVLCSSNCALTEALKASMMAGLGACRK